MADPADQQATGISCEVLERGIPRLALGARHADLDELVVLERATGFRNHPLTDPGIADQDDGLQGVGEATQISSLLVVERHGPRL